MIVLSQYATVQATMCCKICLNFFVSMVDGKIEYKSIRYRRWNLKNALGDEEYIDVKIFLGLICKFS